MLYLQKSLEGCTNSAFLFHLTPAQSPSSTHYCLLNSCMHFKPTSLLLLRLTIWVPVTSWCSRCPTAPLTNGGSERERKETGVDRGEDAAYGSRGSINSLSSWWLLWEGGWGYGWGKVFISQLMWFSLKSFKTLGLFLVLMCASDGRVTV